MKNQEVKSENPGPEDHLRAFKELSEYIERIFEMSPVGSCVIDLIRLTEEDRENDPDFFWHEQARARIRTRNVNSNMCDMFGFSKDEFIGKSIFDPLFVDEDNAKIYVREILRREKGKKGSYEIELKHKKGHMVPVIINAIPILIDKETGRILQTLGMITDLSEIKKTEAALRKSEEKFRQLAENIREVFWIYSMDQDKMVYVSPAYQEIWGRTPKSLYRDRESFIDSIHPDDRQRIITAFDKLNEEPDFSIEYRIKRPDGIVRWIHDRGFPIKDSAGQVYRIAGIAEDITERKLTEEELSKAYVGLEVHVQERTAELSAANAALMTEISERKKAEERLKLYAEVFTHTSEGIMITDCKGVIESVNRAFTDITGYSTEDTVGQNPRILKSGKHDAAFYKRLWTILLEKGEWKGVFWNKRKSGELYPQETSINAIKDHNGNTIHYAAIFNDITFRKKAEEMLVMLSTVDSLTGLSNRRAFDEFLSKEWNRALRGGYQISMILLDIDFFKQYNDTYGHLKGDECLQQVAKVLKRIPRRPGDIAARFGGEEFMIILTMTDLKNAVKIAENIRKAMIDLSIPHETSGVFHYVTVSLGVAALRPERHMSAADLIEHADKALYQAKHEGRNRVAFIDTTKEIRD